MYNCNGFYEKFTNSINNENIVEHFPFAVDKKYDCRKDQITNCGIINDNDNVYPDINNAKTVQKECTYFCQVDQISVFRLLLKNPNKFGFFIDPNKLDIVTNFSDLAVEIDDIGIVSSRLTTTLKSLCNFVNMINNNSLDDYLKINNLIYDNIDLNKNKDIYDKISIETNNRFKYKSFNKMTKPTNNNYNFRNTVGNYKTYMRKAIEVKYTYLQNMSLLYDNILRNANNNNDNPSLISYDNILSTSDFCINVLQLVKLYLNLLVCEYYYRKIQ